MRSCDPFDMEVLLRIDLADGKIADQPASHV